METKRSLSPQPTRRSCRTTPNGWLRRNCAKRENRKRRCGSRLDVASTHANARTHLCVGICLGFITVHVYFGIRSACAHCCATYAEQPSLEPPPPSLLYTHAHPAYTSNLVQVTKRADMSGMYYNLLKNDKRYNRGVASDAAASSSQAKGPEAVGSAAERPSDGAEAPSEKARERPPSSDVPRPSAGSAEGPEAVGSAEARNVAAGSSTEPPPAGKEVRG
eukprot:1177544-Prorocentrum_minimum.AAC.1